MESYCAILFKRELKETSSSCSLLPIGLLEGLEWQRCFQDTQGQLYKRYDDFSSASRYGYPSNETFLQPFCYGFAVTEQALRQAFPNLRLEERHQAYLNFAKNQFFWQTIPENELVLETWMQRFYGKEILVSQAGPSFIQEWNPNLLFFRPVPWKEEAKNKQALLSQLNQKLVQSLLQEPPRKTKQLLELEQDIQSQHPLTNHQLFDLIEDYQLHHPKFVTDELGSLFSLTEEEIPAFRLVLQAQKMLAQQLEETPEVAFEFHSVLSSYYQYTMTPENKKLCNLVKRNYYDTIVGTLLEQQDDIAFSMLRKIILTIPEYHYLWTQATYEPFNSTRYFETSDFDYSSWLFLEEKMELAQFLYQKKKKEQLSKETLELLYQQYDPLKEFYHYHRIKALTKQRNGYATWTTEEKRYFELVAHLVDSKTRETMIQEPLPPEVNLETKRYTYAGENQVVLPLPKQFKKQLSTKKG